MPPGIPAFSCRSPAGAAPPKRERAWREAVHPEVVGGSLCRRLAVGCVADWQSAGWTMGSPLLSMAD